MGLHGNSVYFKLTASKIQWCTPDWSMSYCILLYYYPINEIKEVFSPFPTGPHSTDYPLAIK